MVPIPPNRPIQRADEADLIYKTEDAKFDAVVADLAERHEKGQPVLVGTASVEKSELLSKLLLRAGVPHEVLNAKNHAREAAIIAQAGRSGAVTVATNMAGRGTDIILGGNVDYSADFELRAKGLTPDRDARGVRGGLAGGGRGGQEDAPRPRPRRSATPAACTCWAPSATSPGGSTTSCVAGPVGRATRGSRGSTSRSATT